MGLAADKSDDGPMQIVDVEDEFTNFVKNLEQNTILTGIPFIDSKMPLTLGTNAAIVGAPGSGKTTLALNILKNCSAKNMTTVFFSLDMHRKRMFEKIMYDVTGLSRPDLYQAFKEGKGKELVKKMKELYGNVWFYDRSGTRPQDMAEYIKMVESHTGTKVKLVMIDYLERVSSEKNSDTEASKDIAQKIQDLVMDLDIACVTLVQPNKNAYNGGPDSPIENMAAIKGSSYLQQSYRNIISLWRPGYTPTLSEQGHDRFIEFAILKNDLGEMGKTVMGFEGAKGRIRPLEDFEYAEHKQLLEYKRQLSSEDKKSDGWD
jgi:replicative DNA helicase